MVDNFPSCEDHEPIVGENLLFMLAEGATHDIFMSGPSVQRPHMRAGYETPPGTYSSAGRLLHSDDTDSFSSEDSDLDYEAHDGWPGIPIDKSKYNNFARIFFRDQEATGSSSCEVPLSRCVT